MLTTLRIKNLALVADLFLELRPGYNVITGETGAGKSILIGALNLVLGERADRSMIRSGCDSCSVEAVFDISGLKFPLGKLLEENGIEPCEEHQLVLKRTLTAAGANRQFINGSPTTLAVLAAVGEGLVDIHGPHEHQSLLHPGQQLSILDAFGKLEEPREAFGNILRQLQSLQAEKSALVVDEKTYAQQLDLLRFQVNEISAARLQAGEEEQVEQDYKRASNAARLLELSQAAIEALSEADGSVLAQTGTVGRTLQELQRVDASAAGLVQAHQEATASLRELQEQLSRYHDKVDLDPARLGELEERVNLLQTLRRKYGASVAEVIRFGEEARQKLQSLEQRDAELARINAVLEKSRAELWRAGKTLSGLRRKLIPRLAKAVGSQLSDLGFKQSWFDVAPTTLEEAEAVAETARVGGQGLDTVEFQFAPNPGEPPRSLRAIASSGELARVMLALKTVLAAVDQVPVLVFDEVDANVGGETARTVGEKMRQIANNRQVLCITHLPQVAAPATAHFLAAKQVKDGRTFSEISLLDKAARITELTRMLGGQTEAARKHAEALLKPD